MMIALVPELQQHAFCKQDKISPGSNHMRSNDVTAGSTQRWGNCVLNLFIHHFI
jgi:hypothetical protein